MNYGKQEKYLRRSRIWAMVAAVIVLYDLVYRWDFTQRMEFVKVAAPLGIFFGVCYLLMSPTIPMVSVSRAKVLRT